MTSPPNPSNVLDERPVAREVDDDLDVTSTAVVLDCAEAATLAPAGLADHLEATHHALLRDELPRLEALADDVALAHARRHPELLDVQRLVGDLRGVLEPHLHEEEVLLFPMVRRLADAVAAGTAVPDVRRSVLTGAIPAMAIEHRDVCVALTRMRELTDAYRVPADASDDYRALLEGLAMVEADVRQHVAEENELLAPAVLDLLDEA